MKKPPKQNWLTRAFKTAFNPWSPVEQRIVATADYTEAVGLLADSFYQDVKNISICRFLLDETRRTAEAKLTSLRTLEGKAIAQVGVAGTILALLAAFGSGIPFAWKAPVLLLLVIAILAYLRAGYVRSGNLPSLGGYLSDTVVADPQNEARVALQLAASWSEYSLEIEQANEIKANFTRTGNFWLQTALVALLAVAFFTADFRQESSVPGVNIMNETPAATKR